MSGLLKDPMIVRQLIMDHYEYPRNHELLTSGDYFEEHMDSESCIDDIKVQMIVEDKLIKDVRFDGIACTISTASTSIMTELLKGKTVDEAEIIVNEYNKMIFEHEYDEEILDSAVIFSNVSKQANRIKCATIGWDAAQLIIDESRNKDE